MMEPILKCFAICSCFVIYTVIVSCNLMEPMMGPGVWSMLEIQQCPNAEQYTTKADVKRTKINRTHEVYNIHLTADENFDETYAIRIEVCKWVEGGCKPYQTIDDESFCRLIKRFAADSIKHLMEGMGLDPNTCTVPAGEYDIQNYMFNYEELPDLGIYGKYGAKEFLVKDGVDIACLDATVQFSREIDE